MPLPPSLDCAERPFTLGAISNIFEFLNWFGGLTQELGRILGVRLSPGLTPRPSAHDTTVGRSLTRVLQLVNAGRGEEARYELLRLSMLVKHLQEIESARPDLIPSFASRLVTRDVSAYFGAREEIAVAASLIRAGRQFAHEPTGGPDFRVTFAGGTVGLECTSAHVSTSLETPDIYVRDDPEPEAKAVAYKLASAIRAKEKRAYAAPDVALFIDATNVWALSAPPRPNMKPADEALAAGSYGAAVFHSFIFDLEDELARRAYVRRDSPKITPILTAFLDEHYPLGSLEIKEHVRPLIP